MLLRPEEQVEETPFNFKQAQLSTAISAVSKKDSTDLPIRFVKASEPVQLAPEHINIVGITEKVQQPGELYPTEVFYPVLGEEAQKALLNELKTLRLVVAVTISNEQFVAMYKAPSPNGYSCEYYESSLAAFPAMQKGYGRLVNDKIEKSYRYEIVQFPKFSGEFLSPDKALEAEYKGRAIVKGDEEVLVRLGKTFNLKPTPTPTPEAVEAQPVDNDADIDIDFNIDFEIEDEFVETPSENAKLAAFLDGE